MRYTLRERFALWVCRLCGVETVDGEISAGLLMRCVPHIETAMSEHNDGFRLYGEVCRHLYNFGYEGWLDRLTDPRSRYAAGLSQDPLDNADPEGQGELPPTANSVIRAAYRELKDGTPENRILRARGGVPLSQSRAAAVASDNPPLFGPTPTCFVPVEEAEPFSNSIFGEAQ